MPSRSNVEGWSPDHLVEHAKYWRQLADNRETVFNKVKSDADGMKFTGQGATAMREVVDQHHATAMSQAATLNSAAQTAEDGAATLSGQHQQILSAVNDAENNGFQIGDEWQVTPPGSGMEQLAMLSDAEAIQSQLGEQVGQFYTQETQVATAVAQHAAQLAPEGLVQCYPGASNPDLFWCYEEWPDGGRRPHNFDFGADVSGEWPD